MMNKSENSSKLKFVILSLVIVLFFLVNFVLGWFFVSKNHTEDYVKFINVGKSDSALIYSNGYCALIDTGAHTSANDVALALSESDIKTIDVLVISHLHKDHTGGLLRILETFEVKNLIIPKLSESEEGYEDVISAKSIVETSDGKVFTSKQGMNFKIGDFEITILAHYTDFSDENNRSQVLMAKIGDNKFLFTGDIEKEAEELLLNEGLNLKCNVLKVAHHGSHTSSTEDFIKATKPDFAIINTTHDNDPDESVISNFNYYNSKVLRTDESGDITFKIIDGELKLYFEG